MSVDTCGAIGTILGHDTFSAVIGGKGVGSEDGGALLNCGGHHLPLQGLRVGSADCSGRVRGSLGDVRPLGSPGQEDLDRPGEVFRGWASEPDRDSQPPEWSALVRGTESYPPSAAPRVTWTQKSAAVPGLAWAERGNCFPE